MAAPIIGQFQRQSAHSKLSATLDKYRYFCYNTYIAFDECRASFEDERRKQKYAPPLKYHLVVPISRC